MVDEKPLASLTNPTDEKTKKLKNLSLMRNIHNLTPQIQQKEETDSVAIIKALGSNKLIDEIVLQLEGQAYDSKERAYVEYRRPIMNKLGIGNFRLVISSIAQTIEFGSFKEKEINQLVKHFFKINYPYFTIYFEDYNLDRKDFNLIANLLLTFIISSFSKAKGAGHRNVVRGTYSEDLLGRYVGDEPRKKEKSRFNLGRLNPFRKARDL